MKLILVILFLYYQGPSRVESLTLTSAMLDKLRSITQWLDSVTDAKAYDYIYRINRGAGLNLFQGDIKGYNPRQAQMRTAITNHQQLWNTRVVPYVIDSSFDSASRKDILAAIDEYHAKTCIKFVPRTTEADYVHFKQISGCYSNVGRTGGAQDISLMGACLKKGTAIHEMMHALGFWHEQSRPDRDSWVQIIKGNIQSGKSYNFDKLSTAEADTLNVPYDYGSVMHYSKYAFSKNGNPTILPTRQTNAELGQRDGLSPNDVKRIRKLYGCGSSAPTTATTKSKDKPTTTKKPMTNPPQTQPPKTQPPQTQPPQTQPPQTQPPHTQPPQTQPPQTQPPQTQPPQTQPPQTQPPQTQPPQTQPPKTQQPQTQQPQTQQPQTQQPQTQQPQTQPPASQQPTTLQPVHHSSWTTWSLWSPCDLECRHSRYRFCLNYDQAYCPGENSQVQDCPYPCKPAVELGCWSLDPKNVTIPSVEGKSLNLSDSYKDRTEAVRKCGDYASSNGYDSFALFDHGQCLTGPEAYLQVRANEPSNTCDYTGTGSELSVNAYTFKTDVDGHWSLWTGWSQCTKTCGLGRQYRYRRCDNPTSTGNGGNCPGYDQETAICNVRACIVPVKCGTKYHAGGPGSSGLIWVRDYENFMECEYQIATGDSDATISVLIHEIDIEPSRGCIYDSLMLHDGQSARSPLVGAYCGGTAPGMFESSLNYVYLKFVSDETNTGHGYTIFYNINSRSRKACVKPPASAHVDVYSEGNMVGNRVWYTCHPGYKLVGHSPITCMDQPGFALWNQMFPRCVYVKKRSISRGYLTRCTFEETLCGLSNDEDNTYNWTVKTEGPLSSNISIEVPPRPVRGNFLHSESTRLQEPGEMATIRTGFYDNTLTRCLTFDYRIDGGDMAVLTVYAVLGTNNATWSRHRAGGAVRAEQPGDESVMLWQQQGRETLDWATASMDIDMKSNFQIVFQSNLSNEIGSSSSIDNVDVQYGACRQ